MKRRNVLAGLGALLTAGCSKIGDSKAFESLVDGAEKLHRGAHRLLGGRQPMAREFSLSDISPDFRGNGNTEIDSDAYRAHATAGFADWRLNVRGLVERPLSLTMEQIRALPQRTQITRHDCVEGWSAIGKWKGVPLARILDLVQPTPAAKYIVFHCMDSDDSGALYYESIDLIDAVHPQTLLAYELNGQPLPVDNGAPLRLRVENQLGYKHAKYIRSLELIASLKNIGQGKGGYWEDQGYEWYAGI